MILSLNSIKKSFGVNEVLRDVGFIANEGERVALIGANGAGKTTLFRIITGEMAADSGEIAIKKGAKIGYLSQVSELDFKKTIYEELISTFDYLIKLESDIRRLEQRMEKEHSEAIMQRYASLISEFESKNGYEYQSRTRGIMTGLGFEEAEFDLSIGLLSGGQKTRVALAKLLLSDPDLLLLDEPTNHLDIASISWLENYFTQDFKKSLVIISHDRYFMDKVVDKVVEIEHGKSLMYSGNYSQFIEKKMADLDSQIHRYESQQKEIARQEKSIALLLSFNREKSVRRARSKQKQLAKVERVEKPKNAPDSMRLELKPKRQSGNDVLTARDIEKSFGNRQLFRNVDMDIKKGETVALIGANGIGKTTLFGIILEKS
ncbi:MAG: ATP-binding cassette domain-containing protein, partial [Defluviitaleaceae bacterium]|nr:ATP-binding cassette domain-containing protein [Defluviitaleaceae bacterium]